MGGFASASRPRNVGAFGVGQLWLHVESELVFDRVLEALVHVQVVLRAHRRSFAGIAAFVVRNAAGFGVELVVESRISKKSIVCVQM